MQQGKNIYFSLLDELETKVMTPPETDNKYLHWMYELDEEEQEKLRETPEWKKRDAEVLAAQGRMFLNGYMTRETYLDELHNTEAYKQQSEDSSK